MWRTTTHAQEANPVALPVEEMSGKQGSLPETPSATIDTHMKLLPLLKIVMNLYDSQLIFVAKQKRMYIMIMVKIRRTHVGEWKRDMRRFRSDWWF